MINGKANLEKSQKDEVILLSEDESDPEVSIIEPDKENVHKPVVDPKLLIRRIENELRDEENMLVLMQQLRASQRSNNPQVRPNQKLTAALTSQKNVPVSSSNISHPTPAPTKPSAPVVTKQVALAAIEQQFAAKRSALKKHLEKALEKVPMPTPNLATGLSEVAFVPSALSNEFTSLIGLEEVCRSIQEYDVSSNKNESRRVFSPFACSRCKTDFTPVWKRERPGSTGVVCESCLAGSHRAALQKEYESSIKAALKQHASAEKDLEKEYEDLVNKPENLETFMKEHEKKLLAAAQQQQAVSQTVQNNKYYNNHKSTPTQNARSRSSINGLPQSQTTTTPIASATPAASASSTSANLNPSIINAQTLQQLTPIQQAQLLNHLQQQQQLVAAVAKTSNVPNSNNLNANAMLAVASAAAPQAQQLQQQQLLASVLANLQPQQQVQSNDQSAQMAQFQNVLLNSIMGQNRLQNNTTNRQQQLLQQTLMHFTMLQQQAQQQSNVQQQQAVYNAIAHQQQMALLQQMVQQQQLQASQAPNQQQATLNLLQNLHSLGVTSQQTGGKK